MGRSARAAFTHRTASIARNNSYQSPCRAALQLIIDAILSGRFHWQSESHVAGNTCGRSKASGTMARWRILLIFVLQNSAKKVCTSLIACHMLRFSPHPVLLNPASKRARNDAGRASMALHRMAFILELPCANFCGRQRWICRLTFLSSRSTALD